MAFADHTLPITNRLFNQRMVRAVPHYFLMDEKMSNVRAESISRSQMVGVYNEWILRNAYRLNCTPYR